MSIATKALPETTKFVITACEYHSKKLSKNNCQGVPLAKDCMRVTQLKGMSGVSQSKVVPGTTTIKRSAKKLQNYYQGVSKSKTKKIQNENFCSGGTLVTGYFSS